MTVETDVWIEDILGKCQPVAFESDIERQLTQKLIDLSFEKSELVNGKVGLLLAASFDLLVASQYYSALSHAGWFYCPGPPTRLYFHYTNCCPQHVLQNVFHFQPSNKPESGKIGTATSRLLLLFLNGILSHQSRTEEVLKGTEPVDAVIVDREGKRVFFAEIKASPLVTPAISVESQRLTMEVDGTAVSRDHDPVDNTNLFSSQLSIMVPIPNGDNWTGRFFPIGSRADEADKGWGIRGILELLNGDDDFFEAYVTYWLASLKSYHPKSRDSIFWLTNACGAPSPMPDGWPKRRRGSGYESISDSKTSVGMDRTDDIKKGIYQVLKLGSVGKPHASEWHYATGLLSNIHAARHFDEYLDSLSDVVWALDATGRAKKASDLPADQPIYNLFDGIIAFTSANLRDEWLADVFKWQD